MNCVTWHLHRSIKELPQLSFDSHCSTYPYQGRTSLISWEYSASLRISISIGSWGEFSYYVFRIFDEEHIELLRIWAYTKSNFSGPYGININWNFGKDFIIEVNAKTISLHSWNSWTNWKKYNIVAELNRKPRFIVFFWNQLNTWGEFPLIKRLLCES